MRSWFIPGKLQPSFHCDARKHKQAKAPSARRDLPLAAASTIGTKAPDHRWIFENKEVAMKHNKGKFPSDADLSNNPGIGTSKGTIKEGDDLALEGENTIEGDIENDVGQGGGINPRQKMRTNK
jgi:hypothetical protein